MDYEAILKDIKPTIDEKQHIDDVSSRIMNFLQNACDSRNIDANVNLVGSVAKNTALKGKSDIDIFIAFPLDTEKQYLKDKGLRNMTLREMWRFMGFKDEWIDKIKVN